MNSVTEALFQPWQDFYLLTATASATLAGLLFVSMTFSVGVVKENASQAIRIWAEPTLGDFVQVLVISSLAEFPGLPPWLFGALLLVYDARRILRLVEVIYHFKRTYKPEDLESGDWLELVLYPGLLYSLLLFCGLGLILSWPWILPALGSYTLITLLLGINNTWSQLVWITVEKNKAP